MITSPLSADRALIQKLRAGATGIALRSILALAPGAPLPIYRFRNGLKPAAWPHIVIRKEAAGVRSHVGVPRLMRDKFRVVAAMRDDKLAPGAALLEDCLEPLCIAILADLCDLTVSETNAGGTVWRSHIENPRFEASQSLSDTVTLSEMGAIAVFLSR